jgi:hypothetical protein
VAVLQDRGQEGAAEEHEGVFVVARGDTAPLLQSTEPAFDGVALGVAGRIETGWTASARAPAGPVFALVRAFRNGVPDPSTPQLAASGAV